MAHPLRRSKCRPSVGMVFEAGGRQYVLEGKVGDGAVGIVRKARDRSSGKTVAVKFLAPDPKYIDENAFDDVAQRFRREGNRGAALSHEHLVEILAYEENTNGQCFGRAKVHNPFIVMEFVRGTTVESLIKSLGRPIEGGLHISLQTLTLAEAVTRALLHLHERRIVHRDVKPANIFISASRLGSVPATIRLGDFGVTKWGDFLSAASTGTLTTTTQRGLGTLKYMSPEQALSPRDVTVRSDMFSLGITLFELFTGRILPSTHHVYEIVHARAMRGGIGARLYALEITTTTPFDEDIMSSLLDMFLAASGRPSSTQMAGRFGFWLDRLRDSGAS